VRPNVKHHNRCGRRRTVLHAPIVEVKKLKQLPLGSNAPIKNTKAERQFASVGKQRGKGASRTPPRTTRRMERLDDCHPNPQAEKRNRPPDYR